MIDPHNFPPAISLERVTVRYHHAHNSAVKNITTSIPQHTITAIVGPNGSGKSTLIKAVVGLVTFQGKIHTHLIGKKDSIGYVPQHHSINTSIPITVSELLTISYPDILVSNKMITNTLTEVGANSYKNSPINQLSGGQLQRVLIARALIADPPILILDEPEAGIDSQGEINFYELLKHMKEEKGLTILLASHEIEMVEKYADFVICLNKHLVATGAPNKVLDESIKKAMYHHHV